MRRTELMRRLGWSAWALVPVALLAFHFGPGKTLAAREIAATRFREASELERQAIELQAEAYRAHLETIERRREAFLDGDEVDESPDEDADAIAADDRERIAYEAASTAWASVADAYAQVEERLVDDDPRTIDRIRWSKARALVRSGAIWDGVVDLEPLIGAAIGCAGRRGTRAGGSRGARDGALLRRPPASHGGRARPGLAGGGDQGSAALPVARGDRGGGGGRGDRGPGTRRQRRANDRSRADGQVRTRGPRPAAGESAGDPRASSRTGTGGRLATSADAS